jgi:hypothetical protein
VSDASEVPKWIARDCVHGRLAGSCDICWILNLNEARALMKAQRIINASRTQDSPAQPCPHIVHGQLARSAHCGLDDARLYQLADENTWLRWRAETAERDADHLAALMDRWATLGHGPTDGDYIRDDWHGALATHARLVADRDKA